MENRGGSLSAPRRGKLEGQTEPFPMANGQTRSFRAPAEVWDALYAAAEREGLNPSAMVIRDWRTLYMGEVQAFQPPRPAAPRGPPWLRRLAG